MTNVAALKRLATAIINSGLTADDVPGKTTADVIDYLTNYYAGKYVGKLTVSSVAGSTAGTTKITVTPATASGHSYVYKISPNRITWPAYLQKVNYTAWDGAADIECENGHYVGIYEINSKKQVLKFGQITATSKLG